MQKNVFEFNLFHKCTVDIFFVLQTQKEWEISNNPIILIIFILSLLFIIIPIFINYYQLHKAITQWIQDIEMKKIINSWIQTYLRSLYLICIHGSVTQ